MNKKPITVFILLVLLTSVAMPFFASEVKADGPINVTINSDGSITQSSQVISTSDQVTYTLTGNFSGLITIQKGNIVLDGAGYTLTGSGSGNGIYVDSVNNVLVTNLKVDNFADLISLRDSEYDTVTACYLTNGIAISLDNTNHTRVSNNTIIPNQSNPSGYYQGIMVRDGSYNNVTENIVSYASNGIGVDTIRQIGIMGHYNNISCNTVSHCSNAGIAIAENACFNTIEKNNLTFCNSGIYFIGSQQPYYPRNNTVLYNRVNDSDYAGISISSAPNATITGNLIDGSTQYGIMLDDSWEIDDCDTVTNNTILNCPTGMQIGTSNTTITGNFVLNSQLFAIYLLSNNDTVYANFFECTNREAIAIENGLRNKIYHNDFVHDGSYAALYSAGANTWDNGYPAGGNYWSSLDKVDTFNGSNQNIAGADQIVDTPLTIDTNNIDHYPLVHPFNVYTLTISSSANGATDPSAGTYTERIGSTVQVTAKPNSHYVFDHWLLDEQSVSGNPISVTIDQDHTLQPVFELSGYTVTFTESGLVSGTNWTVTLDGTTHSSTTSTISFAGLENGNYAYSFTIPSGYGCSSASTGTITVAGSNYNQPVTFTLDTNWYSYRNNDAKTGYTLGNGPLTNQSQWITTADGSFSYSSPAVVNGIVYIGSNDNNVYAYYAATGIKVWNYTTGGAVLSGPAVVNGIVYVGSNDNNVYAFNATTGAKIWNYTTGGWVSTSPVVINNTVYVNSRDKNVYALNASTGAQLWSSATIDTSYSSPAYAEGRIYVVYQNTLKALNATTGALNWSYSAVNLITSAPAVSGGIVYAGSTDKSVYAINATTGAKIWSTVTGGQVNCAPAIAKGIVYVGAGDTKVYALNATTGTSIWNYTAGPGGFGQSSPIVANDIVYIGGGSSDFNVYALVASNGSLIWKYRTGAYFASSPAVSNGVLYMGCADSKLYAFGNLSQYTLTMKTQGQGTVQPGNGTQTEGAYVNLQAIPSAGWSFSGWSGDTSGSTNKTIIITGDMNVTATFTENIYYTLTMITVGDGTVAPGNQTYLSGTSVDLQAINAEHWTFDSWSGDASGATNTTISMNGNKTVTATFTQNRYSVIFTESGLPSGTSWTVTFGGKDHTSTSDTITFMDVEDSQYGYSITDPSGYSSSSSSGTVTVNGDDETVSITFTSTYTPPPPPPPVNSYTLTVNSATGGTTDLSAGTYVYNAGSVATVTATASVGYQFSYWLIDSEANSAEATINVTMNAAHTLTPVFTQLTYQLTVNTASGGSTSIGSGTYNYGENSTVTATPSEGYLFSYWILDGQTAGTATSITVQMTANHTLTPVFTPITYSLTIAYTVGGSTTPAAGIYTYNHGQTAAVTAIAADDYRFERWILDGQNATTGTAISIQMISNHTLTAVFAEIPIILIATETTNQNTTYPIAISGGNMTARQMTNMTITPYASNITTVVALNVTGPSGTMGTGTLALPKEAIPYGTIPQVYIDGVLAENQTYTEDGTYFYVTFTTHFSEHAISIIFATPAPPPTPTPTPTPTASPSTNPTTTPTPTTNPTTNPTTTPTQQPTTTPTSTATPTSTTPTEAAFPSYIVVAFAVALALFAMFALVYRRRKRWPT